MPAKNSIKEYVANGYYHIFNRGVEKRNIFIDDQDYGTFLSYLKTYLLPKNMNLIESKLSNPLLTQLEKSNLLKIINLNNFSEEIKLLAYCLMPNHFHLLINQRSANSIDSFINSLNTRYSMYFNRRYNRIGTLFQGVYKAVTVKTDDQLLYLSAYIHTNPLKLIRSRDRHENILDDLTKQPSSLPDYLNQRRLLWLDTTTILNYFSKSNPNLEYKNFILNNCDNKLPIHDIIIEK